MSATPRQIPMEFDHRPALGRQDFLVSPSNAAAVSRVLDWRNWTGRRLAVTGPPGSGKTHLAHVWMHESGAGAVAFADLDGTAAPALAAHGRVVVEDVDRPGRDPGRAARGLFHLHNLLDAHGGWLMVTGRDAPARWGIRLPDLASRLASVEVQRIEPPDDALLSSVLIKLFADRQVAVGPEVVRYLVRHMERSFAEAGRMVDDLDRRSLAEKRPVTRAMAAAMMGRPDDEPDEGA